MGGGQMPGHHEGCPYMPPAPRLDSRLRGNDVRGGTGMTEGWDASSAGVVLVRMEVDRLLSMTWGR